MTLRHFLVGAAALALLAACDSRQDTAANGQSGDVAADDTRDNSSGAIRAGGSADPTATAQNALQAAGNVQATTPAPNRQAIPHRAGDPTPPPTTE